MVLLTFVQIILIHLFKQTFSTSVRSYRRQNGTFIKYMCDNFERKYLSEEMIYLPLTIIFLTTLFVKNRTSRFSNYIMRVYEGHLSSPWYKKNVVDIEKKEIEEKKRELLSRLGVCDRCCYKTRQSWICKFFCCLFCCSCCSNETNRGCCSWCCSCLNDCLGRTECCKRLKCIKQVLDCLCCCSLICCIRRKLIKKPKSINGSHSGHGSDRSSTTSIDAIKEADEAYNATNNTFFFKWPLPFKPFSTTNRLQSVAVYVAYTYDVLNIFMYLYASYIVMPVIPFVKERSGVLVDFLLRILEVRFVFVL